LESAVAIAQHYVDAAILANSEIGFAIPVKVPHDRKPRYAVTQRRPKGSVAVTQKNASGGGEIGLAVPVEVPHHDRPRPRKVVAGSTPERTVTISQKDDCTGSVSARRTKYSHTIVGDSEIGFAVAIEISYRNKWKILGNRVAYWRLKTAVSITQKYIYAAVQANSQIGLTVAVEVPYCQSSWGKFVPAL
jgi:hypothetical protein